MQLVFMYLVIVRKTAVAIYNKYLYFKVKLLDSFTYPIYNFISGIKLSYQNKEISPAMNEKRSFFKELI